MPTLKYIILSFILVMAMPSLTSAHNDQDIDHHGENQKTALRVHELERSILAKTDSAIVIAPAHATAFKNATVRAQKTAQAMKARRLAQEAQGGVDSVSSSRSTTSWSRVDGMEERVLAANSETKDGSITVSSVSGMNWNERDDDPDRAGATSMERHKNRFETHDSDSSVAPYAGMAMDVPLNESWSVFGRAEVGMEATNIKEGRLQDKTYGQTVSTGLSYTF